jgi:hypothetical protein
VKRLYQWLHDRATAFRAEALDGHPHRTVRTEVTVQEQTLLLAGLPLSGDCPLCGQALGPRVHGAIMAAHGSCASPPSEPLPTNETPRVKKELP